MNNENGNYTWKLEDIYVSDEQWEEDFTRVQKLISEVEGYKGKLGKSAKDLLEALNAGYRLQEINEKVFVYASMKLDEDNTNAKYQGYKDRAAGLSAKVQAAVSYIVPEILALPADKLTEFRQDEPGLAVYSFMLDDILRQKPHILSEKEEQIIAQSKEVTQAANNIFKMLNNADLSFGSIKDENGKEVEVTHGNYLSLLLSGDRRVRRDAFFVLYKSYGEYKNTLASILGASVKRDIFYSRVRKHPSALEAALFSDKVPTEVYDNLIDTVRQNLNLMHRYMALRKEVLGLEELRMYDLYTPLVQDIKWEIPYQDAVDMVKEGMAPLGDTYVKDLTKGFESGWVDVYPRKGKTSGAYCWGPYGVHPYVLMNYQNNLNNVFTLAHEMGHAMHSFYSYNEQPYSTAHYSIFTAEVASTVNESLLMHHLLDTVGDKKKKLYLLNHYLEQIRGTVFRQVMFAEFEKIIHQRAEAGEPLTAEVFTEIYKKLNEEYYGPEVVIDEEANLEWARIPHFYNAFYVYKYATGLSAATYLSKQIVEEGEVAVDRYLTFLKSGGSNYPLDLLKEAGVDMASPQPVQDTMDLFAALLDEMEKIIGDK
ncbi:oligoendopeptidase F [Desulfofalx alkaliphila]|uniref:oligoendopeptidase F n=1 Tax=Desulfofalx alkaliphila TaxID=105483 RepID=UPI0004E27253|nr:oligoendopeptidase F [Desulfofalx alkaliphila]